MKKYYRSSIILLIVFIMAGCVQKKNESAESHWRIAVILPQIKDFWGEVWSGIRDSSDALGVDLSEYPSSESQDIDKCFEIAQTANGDGIILFGYTDLELLDALQEARENGKKIIVVDTDIGEQYYDEFIGIDNKADGSKLAAWLLENYHDGEKILILLGYASGAVEERKQAFWDFLVENGLEEQISVLDLIKDEEQNLINMQNAICEIKNLKWVVAFTPMITVQVSEILSRQNLAQEISLIGFGESDTAIEYMQNHLITALLAQDSYSMGKLAVEDMKKLLEGEEPESKQHFIDSVILTLDRQEKQEEE